MITPGGTHQRIDVERLDDVLTFVTESRRSLDSTVWVTRDVSDAELADASDEDDGRNLKCNTTGCFAGWTAIRAGYVPYWADSEDYDTDYVVPGPGAAGLTSAIPEQTLTPDVTTFLVADVAQALTGLTRHERLLMFSGDNTLRDLWEFAVRFTNGAITMPPGIAEEESSYQYAESGMTWHDYGRTWGTDADGNLITGRP
jgi:hypothetical protein